MPKSHKSQLAYNLAQMRNLAGLSQAELAEQLGVGVRTVAAWEGGERIPKTGMVEQFARVCHKNNPDVGKLHNIVKMPSSEDTWEISLLETASEATQSTNLGQDIPRGGSAEKSVRIGIFAFAGAGDAIELFEHEPIKVVNVPKRWITPTIRGVLIRGRSMEPTLMDGAVIGVDVQDTQIVSGEMYAVWIEHEGAVAKRLYAEPNGIRIVSDNSQFEDMILRHEDMPKKFVLGRLKWVMQSY